MRQTFFLLIGLAGVLSFGSCKKYLSVQPEGQYTNPQVFSNESAIKQALNGLYNNMATDSLYGASLSTTAVELLAQQWYTQSSVYISVGGYQYTNANVEPYFEGIWQSAYADILDANAVIEGVTGAVSSGVLTTAHGNLIKGEAMAVRAMLHLDLLRLFGPVMSTNASGPAIPYYRRPDAQVQPILSGTQVLDSVLADLSAAESLLSADPIITGGRNIVPFGSLADFYTGNRSQRLNYYAVKALMARAYLYGGLTAPAHDSALAVINQASPWFPWLSYGSIVGNPANPDRIFSTEVLFGVYNREMYTNYSAVFLPTLSSTVILAQQPSAIGTTFENNENDYRYPTTWQTGSQSLSNFYKYAQTADETVSWGFIQPLVRKSEMYYIVAETDPSATVSFAALDTVRFNRGLQNLAPTATLATEIQKEYQKEFIGEGQLFYFYKRQNVSSIAYPFGYPYTITPIYQVPLPLSETTLR